MFKITTVNQNRSTNPTSGLTSEKYIILIELLVQELIYASGCDLKENIHAVEAISSFAKPNSQGIKRSQS